jgi:phosphoglycerate dehydrogenase-like enzyme
MSDRTLTRRRFLHNVAAGSTGAALAALPAEAAAGKTAPSPQPPYPVTVESFPIAEPGNQAKPEHVAIVTRSGLPDSAQEKIRAYAPHIELRMCRDAQEFRRQVADAHVLYGGFSREDFAAAKELRWIQYTAAGVENILWPELVESPVVLTNMQRIYAPAISETVIGLLLALTRGIPRYSIQTRDHVWKPVPDLVEISELTMGIAGMGGIGTETAYRAHYGFRMKVLGVDPKPLPKPRFVAELHSVDWLPEMARQADVLVSAAPHTPVSEGMFNEAVFKAMKPSAYFINVSRGKLVDTPALIRALEEGWIAGAGLDVAYREPLPPDDPLWGAPNVLITCHSSGHSPRTVGRQMDLFTENVRRYMQGLPLLNVVDKKRGY